jgi:hypothetical protein
VGLGFERGVDGHDSIVGRLTQRRSGGTFLRHCDMLSP